MKFKTVTHENREQWLKWRHDGLGSSDIPVIMGVSRYKDYNELLVEKSALEPKPEEEANSYIKERGNRIEKTVREFYEQKMGMPFKALNTENIENPHRRASLDGIDEGNNLIIEIKLLSSQNVNKLNPKAEGVIKWTDAKNNGIIPVDYYPQLQHQLSVTGAPACVFIGLKEVRTPGKAPSPLTEDDLAIVSVLPDEEYIKNMNKKIDEFWNKVLEKRRENEIRSTTKAG